MIDYDIKIGDCINMGLYRFYVFHYYFINIFDARDIIFFILFLIILIKSPYIK